MKRFVLIFLTTFLSLTGFLAGCASTGGKEISLQGALAQSAEKIAKELQPDSRVVIVAFETANSGLSNYVMEEFTGALVEQGINVADRQNLPYVYRELGFQMSDNVSDGIAQSIGKFLGAQMVISGELTRKGRAYRFRTRAIPVEKKARAIVTRLTVWDDNETQRITVAFGGQNALGRTSRYGVSEQSEPQSAGTFLDRGILFASRGNYRMAVDDFTAALKLKPEMGAAFPLRGKALYMSAARTMGAGSFVASTQITAEQLRIYERALEDFTLALRIDANNAHFYFERGNVYSEKGDFNRAVADYDQAIKLNSNYAIAYNNRGNAYHNRNDFTQAIADYDQAIRLEPDVALRYTNRGLVYYDQKDFDKAIADYDRAIQIEPNALRYYNRGLAYYGKKDFDKAIADYDQAILLAPNASRYYNRGLAYYGKKDFDKAIADYDQAIKLNPNSADTYHNRALAYYDKRDLDKALADFVSELHIDPDNENAMMWFKRIQYER